MNLREANSRIFETECGKLLSDGVSCSQPVLCEGSKGLIDNYFIYSQSRDRSVISGPKVVFGLYSELREVAYINKSPNYKISDTLTVSDAEHENAYLLYERYEELYAQVRDFAFKVCNEHQAKIVAEYCDLLRKISGPVLWRAYKDLFPDFFTWAKLGLRSR